MKVNYSLMGNASGSLGGTVASHNTYGPYLRARRRPVNPNTPGQQHSRLSFSNTSQAWQSLSKEQQAAWVTGGPLNVRPNRVGGSQALTGQALYMRINAFRAQCGLSLLLVPPTEASTPSITAPLAVVGLNGEVEFTFDGGDAWNATGGGMIISVSALNGNGRNFINAFYALGNLQAAASSMTFAIPFSLAAGGLLRFRFAAVTPDGRLTDVAYVDVITPKQAIVEAFDVTGPTAAEVRFSRPVTAADFAAGNFTGDFQTTVTAVAQGGVSSLMLTGTGFSSGDGWILTPTGTAADYTPDQTGITT